MVLQKSMDEGFGTYGIGCKGKSLPLQPIAAYTATYSGSDVDEDIVGK